LSCQVDGDVVGPRPSHGDISGNGGARQMLLDNHHVDDDNDEGVDVTEPGVEASNAMRGSNIPNPLPEPAARPMIGICADEYKLLFDDQKSVGHSITSILQFRFSEPWATWGCVPRDKQDQMWLRFTVSQAKRVNRGKRVSWGKWANWGKQVSRVERPAVENGRQTLQLGRNGSVRSVASTSTGVGESNKVEVLEKSMKDMEQAREKDKKLFEETIEQERKLNEDKFETFKKETNDKLALEKCQLKSTIQSLPNLLDSSVSDEGENQSAGQRQLFCLGRVLLRRNKILALDEATASMNSAKDAILQKIKREDTTRKSRTGDEVFPGDICRPGKPTKRQKFVRCGTNSDRLFSQSLKQFFRATCRPGYAQILINNNYIRKTLRFLGYVRICTTLL
ncbi:ABC transporter C family member 8-like protein isoform X1, partial [Tanacetum coccineum]